MQARRTLFATLPFVYIKAVSSPASDPTGYWRRNLRYLVILLTIWFLVSFGFGVLFVEELNEFRFFNSGFKLGFWFAQQGSIYTFVLLIFVYVLLMNRLDRDCGVSEDD